MVNTDCLSGVPVLAGLGRIVMKLGLSSEVLPVVGVWACFPVVLGVDKRAPDCFVMEVIKISVVRKHANQVKWNLRFIMCKGAILPILTKTGVWQITLTEFGFVLVRVVEFLDSRVRVNTCFSVRALLLLGNVAAELTSVQMRGSATILWFLVVVATLFQIVVRIIHFRALLSFECVQIQSLDKLRWRWFSRLWWCRWRHAKAWLWC